MTNLNQIMLKINGGNGTIGKLVNDQEFYKNAKLSLQKLDKAAGRSEQMPNHRADDAQRPRVFQSIRRLVRNLVEVVIFFECFPRVARASQPWALGRNPVGILGWREDESDLLRRSHQIAGGQSLLFEPCF